MGREDIEAGRPVCRSFNCSDEIGDLAAKVFREFDNLEVLVESKSPDEQVTEDHRAFSNTQAEGCEEGLLCPSFNSYSCSDKLADIAVKVLGEFDQLPSLERKSEDHTDEGDDDFTFAPVPKWGHKFYFGPVYPVFNRDLLVNEFSQLDLEAVEEKSKPTTTTAPSAGRLTLNELFKQVDGSRFAMPSSTSNSTRSSAYNWKLRDIFRRTNTEGQTMSSSRSSKKKRQRRSWVDRCLGHMRLLCFSSS